MFSPLPPHTRRNPQRCIPLLLQDLRLLAVTTLLGKPFAKSLLYFFLRYRALRISRLQTIAHLFNDKQVILNVLDRAVVWQLA